MMLSSYGRPHTLYIIGLTVAAIAAAVFFERWWVAGGVFVAAALLLAFFRDPGRRIPAMRGQVVAPADGRISSIHTLEHFEPFDGPAVCVRIFLSVFDVHVNRAPLHGRIASMTHKPGKHLNALKAESAEHNESMTLVVNHPTHDVPVAVVRQVAGAIARRIVVGVYEGDIVQRGQRIGMIKFGSTTELYLPDPDRVELHVRQGQRVRGGASVLAMAPPPNRPAGSASVPMPASKTSDERDEAEAAAAPQAAGSRREGDANGG